MKIHTPSDNVGLPSYFWVKCRCNRRFLFCNRTKYYTNHIIKYHIMSVDLPKHNGCNCFIGHTEDPLKLTTLVA